MIEEILAEVLQDAGLSVHLGSVPPNSSYPCVVYQRISTPIVRTHIGAALEYPRFQITCWGRGDNAGSDAINTAETVKLTLDLNQVDFMLATKEGEFDIEEIEQKLFRRILDFYIWFEPSIGS